MPGQVVGVKFVGYTQSKRRFPAFAANLPGGGGGATNFLGLTDTPASYVGAGGLAVQVNVGETGLEFVPGGGAFVPIAGGTMTGDLLVGATSILLDESSGQMDCRGSATATKWSLKIGGDSASDTGRTNNTTKKGIVAAQHYTLAQPEVYLLGYTCLAGQNVVNIGGGSSVNNNATMVRIHAASTSITVGSTVVCLMSAEGTRFQKGAVSATNYLMQAAGQTDSTLFIASRTQDVISIGSIPVVGAKLAVSSTTAGFLPPRMTLAQRNAAPTVMSGLQAHETDSESLDVYDGTAAAWKRIGPADYGEIYVTAGGDTQDFPTAGSYVKLDQFTVNGPSRNATPDHTNDIITVDNVGIYLVSFQTSFSGTLNSTWTIKVYWNGVAQEQVRCTRKLGTGGDVGACGSTGIVIVTTAATDFDLRATADSNGDDLVLVDGQLTVTRVA
ncbi:MAG: hypothetical protein GY906_23530 [bacterium]|nr:hypothetical protein [bacterium]